jgi:hypothetical protein
VHLTSQQPIVSEKSLELVSKSIVAAVCDRRGPKDKAFGAHRAPLQHKKEIFETSSIQMRP